MVVASQKAEDPNHPSSTSSTNNSTSTSVGSSANSKKQKSSIFVSVDQGKLAIRGASNSSSLASKHSISAQNLPTGTTPKEKSKKLSFLNPRKYFTTKNSASSSKPDVEIRASSQPKSLNELISADKSNATRDGESNGCRSPTELLGGLEFQTKSVSEVNLRQISPGPRSLKNNSVSVGGQLDEELDDEEELEESVVSVQEAVAAIESLRERSQPSTPTTKSPRGAGRSTPTKTMGNSCSYTLKHNLPNSNGDKDLTEMGAEGVSATSLHDEKVGQTEIPGLLRGIRGGG